MVATVVIVIMGDVESSRNRVGRLLAEYLGWEFTDVESLHRASLSSGSLNDADCARRMKELFSAIDSLNYEWRDVIVSSSILDEDDQSLHYHHPLVKFVQLKATDTDRGSGSPHQETKPANYGVATKGYVAPEPYDRVLTVDSSQKVDQILSTVLSELILK